MTHYTKKSSTAKPGGGCVLAGVDLEGARSDGRRRRRLALDAPPARTDPFLLFFQRFQCGSGLSRGRSCPVPRGEERRGPVSGEKKRERERGQRLKKKRPCRSTWVGFWRLTFTNPLLSTTNYNSCGHLSSALPSLRRDASPAAGRLAAAARGKTGACP